MPCSAVGHPEVYTTASFFCPGFQKLCALLVHEHFTMKPWLIKHTALAGSPKPALLHC